MGRRAYHAAVFHLMVINFPYALIAWIYLFIFTLVSVQSLGSGLSGMCWWLIPCSRPVRPFWSRCLLEPSCASLIFLGPGRSPEPRSAFLYSSELVFSSYLFILSLHYKQSFMAPSPFLRHIPLDQFSSVYALPSFPRQKPVHPAWNLKHLSIRTPMHWCVRRPSIYHWCLLAFHGQFTDATTYQALFYFLVIKPGITLCTSIVLIVLVPVSYVLVLPAPLMLRFVRKIGIWQANVAVEGLYYQVT